MSTQINHKGWIEEIIRETEHYYQGEQQQEERASWLLGTVCAILAIIISFYASSGDCTSLIKITLSKNWVIIIFLSFLISAIMSIIGIMPLNGTKVAFLSLLKLYRKINNEKDLFYFVERKFSPNTTWDNVSLESWIIHHYQLHYVRNHFKSQLIMLSSIFLLLGLIFCFVVIISY